MDTIDRDKNAANPGAKQRSDKKILACAPG